MESFVQIAVIESIISFGVMNQLESGICTFEEKITNPEVKKTIDVNSLVFVWNILECHAERNINQHITNPVAISEKVTIETIIAIVVVNKNLRLKTKLTDYMPVIRMMVIVFVILVSIRIVIFVVIYPAVLIPAVSFPASVPVIVVIGNIIIVVGLGVISCIAAEIG